MLALALMASVTDVARGESFQIEVTELDCGYDVQANTFRPIASIKRTDLQGFQGQTDERVTVRFRLLDANGTSVATLSGAVIEGDDTITIGAAEIPVGVTRQFRPFDGVSFGDGGADRPALLRSHPYDIRVEGSDFDIGDVYQRTFSCPTQPDPSGKAIVRIAREGSGSGRITADGTALDCGSICEVAVDSGSSLTLRAQPDPSSRFESWNVPGCDSALTCELHPTEDVLAKPRFQLLGCSDEPVQILGAEGGLDSATFERPSSVRGLRVGISVRLDRMAVCSIGVGADATIAPAPFAPPAGPGTVGFAYAVSPPDGRRTFVYALPTANWVGLPPSDGLRVASATQPMPFEPGIYDLARAGQLSIDLFALPALEQRTTLVGSAGTHPSLVATTVPQVIVSFTIAPEEMLDDFDEFRRYVSQPIPVYARVVQSALGHARLPPWLEIFPAAPQTRPVVGGFPIAPVGPLVLDLVRQAARAVDRCRTCVSDAQLAKLRVAVEYSAAVAATYALYRLTRLAVTPIGATAFAAQATPVGATPSQPLTAAPLGRGISVKKAFRPLRPGNRKRAARLAGAVLSLPASKADVRGMLLSGRPARGRWIRVLFGRVRPSAKTVQVVLDGPSGRYSTPLPVRKGTAGARIRLPRKMAKGVWTIGAADMSKLKLKRGRMTGLAGVRVGTFRLR